jgi:hypothetical protein
MALKENYKDDILDTSQNVKRKYQMENNGDGTVSFTDVTKYTQQGDSFGASDMNAVNSEVNEVVNNLGAKNMLPNNATTRTIYGVTFTVNNDGSITANGTATATIVLELLANDTSLASGDYILSGSPSGGSGSTFCLWFRHSDGTGSFVNYEGDTEISYTKTSTPLFVGIVIYEGYTANNIVFKPMLRPSGIKDDTYVPYAQTNKELTDNLTWYIQNGWLPVRPSGDVPANMEDCSWAMLKQLASAGTLGNYYQIGDTKTIELNGGERVVMELVSINDGSGNAGEYYPRGTADFISKDCLQTTHSMNSSNTNAGGWVSCALRTTLNTTIYETLPQAVKDAIVEKTHKTSAGSQSTSLVEHTDKLWLPTEYEMFGAITNSANTENANVNKHYAVFDTNADRIKHQGTNGSAVYWWESSPHVSNPALFCGVYSDGSVGRYDAGGSCGVPLCFRIGQLFT